MATVTFKHKNTISIARGLTAKEGECVFVRACLVYVRARVRACASVRACVRACRYDI